jgi:hypothetical protein
MRKALESLKVNQVKAIRIRMYIRMYMYIYMYMYMYILHYPAQTNCPFEKPHYFKDSVPNHWYIFNWVENWVTRWVCEKITQNVAQHVFCHILYTYMTFCGKFLAKQFGLLLFIYTTQRKQSPRRPKFAPSGHPGWEPTLIHVQNIVCMYILTFMFIVPHPVTHVHRTNYPPPLSAFKTYLNSF